jgi:hypothetical protein
MYVSMYVSMYVDMHACPTWEYEAGTYLFKLQRLETKVLLTIENFPRFAYGFQTFLCTRLYNNIV